MYVPENDPTGASASALSTRVDPVKILDCVMLQSIMDDLYTITGYTMAIVDMEGNVLIKTGWQDICEVFHRRNEQCRLNCRDSDTKLAQNIRPGEFKLYQCQNHLWDVATPLMVGGIHLATLYFGQFFFRDNEPEIQVFRQQAAMYGFDEAEYMLALTKVPRYTYEQVAGIMNFLTKFATMISSMNHHRMLVEEHYIEREKLLKTMNMHSMVLDQIGDSITVTDLNGYITYVNSAECRSSGYSRDELIGKHVSFFGSEPDSPITEEEILSNALKFNSYECTLINRAKDGRLRHLRVRTKVVKDDFGTPIALSATTTEIEQEDSESRFS
jgi:PAS domain S-box-containing protein